MEQLVNRQVLLRRRPVGTPTPEDFQAAEGPVGTPGAGEVLLRNLYLSIDPAIRGWMSDAKSYLPPIEIGAPIRSGQAEIERGIIGKHCSDTCHDGAAAGAQGLYIATGGISCDPLALTTGHGGSAIHAHRHFTAQHLNMPGCKQLV